MTQKSPKKTIAIKLPKIDGMYSGEPRFNQYIRLPENLMAHLKGAKWVAGKLYLQKPVEQKAPKAQKEMTLQDAIAKYGKDTPLSQVPRFPAEKPKAKTKFALATANEVAKFQRDHKKLLDWERKQQVKWLKDRMHYVNNEIKYTHKLLDAKTVQLEKDSDYYNALQDCLAILQEGEVVDDETQALN